MTDKVLESKQKDTKICNNFIFSKDNVNMGHQPEFDYLKTLGVFCISTCHVYMHFNNGNDILYIPVYYFTTLLTAGGLMILMGANMRYSRHHEPHNYFARSFVLLTMGQYLNLIRNCLPNVIAWWVTGSNKFIARALLIIQTDILTFAGLAFCLLGIMKKMKLSDNCILTISIIMNFVSLPLFNIMKEPDSYLLRQLLGFFVFTYSEAYFSIFGYFVFVAFGYWIAGYYQKILNKDKFYNRILIFCLPIAAIYQYFRVNNKIPMLTEYNSNVHYYLSPGPDAIHRLMNNMIILAIFYKIDKMLGKTPEFISHCGKNLNQYYMISFIITMHMNAFLKATRGERATNEFKYPDLFGIMLLFISRVLIDINDKYIHFTISTLKNPMRNIVFALIWIMTIISIIYVYPKIEVYSTMWNDYLYEN